MKVGYGKHFWDVSHEQFQHFIHVRVFQSTLPPGSSCLLRQQRHDQCLNSLADLAGDWRCVHCGDSSSQARTAMFLPPNNPFSRLSLYHLWGCLCAHRRSRCHLRTSPLRSCLQTVRRRHQLRLKRHHSPGAAQPLGVTLCSSSCPSQRSSLLRCRFGRRLAFTFPWHSGQGTRRGHSPRK